ncbi:MFS transporter [Opitutia bacterium ISCC 52]|nr:MFS transporter [Opitutae bacterium ISCC 52]
MSSHKPTNVRWLVLGLSSMISLILYVHRYTWTIIRPQLEQEYGFSNTQLEWIFTSFQFSYALGQIPSGIVSDFFGAHIFLSSSIAVWSLCLVLFASVGSIWAFAGARVLFGAAQAGAYPSLSGISGRWFVPSSRTTLQGFISSFAGRMGGALAPVIMATVLIGHFGYSWRMTLVIMSGVGILFAAVFFILYRNSPQIDGRVNDEELKLIQEGTEPKGLTVRTLTPLVIALPLTILYYNWVTVTFLVVALAFFLNPMVSAIFGRKKFKHSDDTNSESSKDSAKKPERKILKLSNAIKHRSYQLLLFQQTANAGADVVYTSVLGSVFVAKGVSWTELGMFASLPLIGGAIGGYVGGYLNDVLFRILGNRLWSRRIMGALGKAIAAGCLLIAISQTSAEALAWGLFVVKFFSDWSQPTVWGACTDIGGPNAGTVFSGVNMMGNIGALVMPLVVGPLLDHYSTMETVGGELIRNTDYVPMFILVACLYLVSSITWLFIDCTKTIQSETKQESE